MPRHYDPQKTWYSKSSNKSIITVSLTLCLVAGLALPSSSTIFSTNHLKQTTQTVKLILPHASSLVSAKWSLQWEQLHLYLEQSLKDHNTSWIAGPAEPLP